MTITEADMLEMIRSIAGIKQPASKINRCSAPVSVVLQQERHQRRENEKGVPMDEAKQVTALIRDAGWDSPHFAHSLL